MIISLLDRKDLWNCLASHFLTNLRIQTKSFYVPRKLEENPTCLICYLPFWLRINCVIHFHGSPHRSQWHGNLRTSHLDSCTKLLCQPDSQPLSYFNIEIVVNRDPPRLFSTMPTPNPHLHSDTSVHSAVNSKLESKFPASPQLFFSCFLLPSASGNLSSRLSTPSALVFWLDTPSTGPSTPWSCIFCFVLW